MEYIHKFVGLSLKTTLRRIFRIDRFRSEADSDYEVNPNLRPLNQNVWLWYGIEGW